MTPANQVVDGSASLMSLDPSPTARFAQAYQVWQAEVCPIYGPAALILDHDTPQGRGEPDTALRAAYEERQAALTDWLLARKSPGESPA